MPATLKSRFPEIVAGLRPRVSAAVKETAEVVQEGAQTRVPVDEGDLYDSIRVERKGPAEYAVIAGGGDVFYATFIEYGTVKLGPRPFMVPAAEASTQAAEGLVTGVLRGL